MPVNAFPSLLAISVALFVASTAAAQPEPVPSPDPTASPTPVVSPAPSPSPTPSPTPSPSPSPSPTPSPSPSPSPTPATAVTPVPAASPAPTPVDYRAGVPGSPKGPRPFRAFAAAGVHVFLGEGWNQEADVPDEDPPESGDYVGGGIRAGGIYEVDESFAAVAQLGGHQGTHALGEEGVEPEPVTVAYGVYYAAVGARWQTRPALGGLYVEAGGGFAAGRVVVTRPGGEQDDAEGKSYPTWMGYAAFGATARVSQGFEVFLEARYMTAPRGAESFTSDDELDLGGVTATAGIALRL